MHLIGNTKKIAFRQTAAELFAASLLEIFPAVQLIEVRGSLLGFVIDCCAPFALKEEQITLVSERVRGKIKEGIEIRFLEMTTRNAVEYMRHLKQFFRERAVDREEQFTGVVQIGDYANVVEGTVLEGAAPDMVFSVDGGVAIGEVRLHKKEVAIQRIIGFVEKDKPSLKEAIRLEKRAKESDHQLQEEFYLFFDGGYGWTPKGFAYRAKKVDAIKEVLRGEGLLEVRMVGEESIATLGEKIFIESLRESGGYGEFGLKDAPLQEVISGYVNKDFMDSSSLLHLLGKFGKISPQTDDSPSTIYEIVRCDPYGIEWVVAEVEEGELALEFVVWLDRLIAITIEDEKKL